MTEPARRKVGGSAPGERRGNAGKGRVKGTPNKTTQAVKDAIVQAFDQAGGAAYLLTVAKEDPKTFCTLLGKVLPLEVKAALDNQHSGTISFTWLPPE